MLRKDKITLYKIIIYNAINIPRFLKNKNHVLYYCRRNFNRKKKIYYVERLSLPI